MYKARKFLLPSFWWPAIFFGSILFAGLLMYDDYGLSWDDQVQRQLGLETWDFIGGKDNNLHGLINRYHNPFIEVLEVLPEKIFHLRNEKEIFLSRHLFNFIFCWAGLIFFYLLALKLFGDYRYALIACLLFVLTPRLFAHCFYNSKDLPFLFLFTATAYFLVRWMDKPSWWNIFWLILISGMVTGARVLGIIFPFLVFFAWVLSIIGKKIHRRELVMMVTYFIFYPVAVYVFFPTIWPHPFPFFLEALDIMSHYPYDVTTFFMGETAHALQTPWYYMLVWMGITIPLAWLIFFMIGVPVLIRQWRRDGFISPSIRWIVVTTWFFLPLAAVILFRSNLYEDGRHLFFIYPAFLLIAAKGIQASWEVRFSGKPLIQSIIRTAAVVGFLGTLLYTTVCTVRFHPYQYAFFNGVGRYYAAEKFDKDYWGLSYRQALEFLVSYDKSQTLPIRWKVDPGEWNLIWLKEEDRKRIQFVPYRECNYYLTNYRSNVPSDASDEKLFEVRVQGIAIMTLYKMKPPNRDISPLP